MYSRVGAPYYLTMANLRLDPNQIWLNGALQPLPQPLCDSHATDLRESLAQVVGGDGSPRSYLSAALLFRALGRRWGRSEVIVSNPGALTATLSEPEKDGNSSLRFIPAVLELLRAGWWLSGSSCLKSWKPSVIISGSSVMAQFCCLAFEGEISLSRHLYRFKKGGYSVIDHQTCRLASNGRVSVIDR